jgi:hypothetical protein
MFRNPRGTQRFYIFYRKNVGGTDTVYYAHTDDITTWDAGDVDLAAMSSANLYRPMVAFVEDAGNSQTIVYLAAENNGGGGPVQLRRGTIADADETITWDTEEELWDNSYIRGGGRFQLAIDPNGYLWTLNYYPSGTGTYDKLYVKASQATTPAAGISWSAILTVDPLIHQYTYINLVPLNTTNGMAGIGLESNVSWAYIFNFGGGAGAPTLVKADYVSYVFSGAYFMCGPGVLDDDEVLHFCFGESTTGAEQFVFKHKSYDTVAQTWGGTTTIYSGADSTAHAITLIHNAATNYLYAVYGHGTGEVEYKTSLASAISWSVATQIEDHAEDCQYFTSWYSSDPVDEGYVFGAYLTQTTYTVRAFRINPGLPSGEVATKVKERGWPKEYRGKIFFLDGDTFVGQDNGRWEFSEDDTGFVWDTAGQVTVPADRDMNTKEKYAFCMLTAIVQSADMSDCKIGFYADANHYAWIDQDSLRTKNGTTDEITTDISAFLPDSTRLKIILIWTSLFVRLVIISLSTNRRIAYQHNNPHQIESVVTFRVISGGSSLLAEDYALFDAEDDIFYAMGLPGTHPMGLKGGGEGANTDIDTSAEQLTTSDIPCSYCIVTAHKDNTDTIWVGLSASHDVDKGTPLEPKDSVTLPVANVNQIYVVAEAADQKATFTYI